MRKNTEWWIGEFWAQPIRPESALRCSIRWWMRTIGRLFRPALMRALMWATWPNTDAFVCNGYGEDTQVEAWIL